MSVYGLITNAGIVTALLSMAEQASLVRVDDFVLFCSSLYALHFVLVFTCKQNPATQTREGNGKRTRTGGSTVSNEVARDRLSRV